jgi:carbon monoxide dehydrogenase subunit G
VVAPRKVKNMLKMTGSVCIDASSDAVWSVLSDLESIPLWVGVIRRAHCPGQRRGLGAVRVCELKQATIRETIVSWTENESFTYRGEGAPMMKSAMNTWTVQPVGEQCLVTTTAEAELSGGVLGKILEPLAKVMFRSMSARTLAALKYLVENGKPYHGDVRELGIAPAGC